LHAVSTSFSSNPSPQQYLAKLLVTRFSPATSHFVPPSPYIHLNSFVSNNV
jgi:hypothetical protein